MEIKEEDDEDLTEKDLNHNDAFSNENTLK